MLKKVEHTLVEKKVKFLEITIEREREREKATLLNTISDRKCCLIEAKGYEFVKEKILLL